MKIRANWEIKLKKLFRNIFFNRIFLSICFLHCDGKPAPFQVILNQNSRIVKCSFVFFQGMDNDRNKKSSINSKNPCKWYYHTTYKGSHPYQYSLDFDKFLRIHLRCHFSRKIFIFLFNPLACLKTDKLLDFYSRTDFFRNLI